MRKIGGLLIAALFIFGLLWSLVPDEEERVPNVGIAQLSDRLRAADPTLREIRTGSGEIYLTRTRGSLQEVLHLRRDQEHSADWRGTLHVNKVRFRQPGWEDCSAQVGAYLLWGDPELVALARGIITSGR